jgi:hypothetical protein
MTAKYIGMHNLKKYIYNNLILMVVKSKILTELPLYQHTRRYHLLTTLNRFATVGIKSLWGGRVA